MTKTNALLAALVFALVREDYMKSDPKTTVYEFMWLAATHKKALWRAKTAKRPASVA